jgi:multisubunit Na+/H+ antiporter MnhB subunit
MRNLLCSAAVLAITLLTACGSGSGTTVPANIRLVNDTTSLLDLDINTATQIASVGAKTSSAYSSIAPGTYTESLATNGTTVPTATGNIGLGTGQNYTTIAFLHNTDIEAQSYAENQTIPSAGYSSLNIANLSVDAGPVDVFLVAHGTAIPANATPTFSSVQGLSTAATLASTSASVAYDIIVTGFGNAADIRLVYSSPAFASAQAYTLALTSTPGGGLVNGVLIPQGIAITASGFYTNPQARVRVLSALPQSPSQEVLVTVGTTALLPDYAPNWTPYQVVAGGSTITSLTVAGSAITVPAIPNGSFTAGGDFTVLVYGTTAAPLAVVFTDTNQIKANSASVRVVNAAVTGGVGLNLIVNGSAKISNVPYGSDAGLPLVYAGVAPSSSPTLQLIGGGYDQTLSGTSVPLVTGAVRTVFVYDATLPPLVISDR